ncbi:hypothetical protein BD769DRAFT_1497734 [Suillus cothurnatus]|nr:hypothetical protein BD769DRAFT_1497734 [Suillus cothurnatus]
MITLQRCIVLAFSTNIVVTSFVLMILIPAWTTPILYVTATLTYIFGIVILSSYPELVKGHSYMLLLTIMNTAMFATIARVFGGTMDKIPVVQGIDVSGCSLLGLAHVTFVVLTTGLSYEIYKGHSEVVGSSETGVSETRNPSHILSNSTGTITHDPESHPKHSRLPQQEPQTYGPSLPLPSTLQPVESSVIASTIDKLPEEDS